MTRPNTLSLGLSCLSHPSSLLCIGVLAFNDHVAKALWGGVATGKVSDFAGLYFFPFLLLVLLAPAERTLGGRARKWLPRAAFCLAGTWFAFTKASPVGNAWTSRIASALAGAPVEIVLDWTDLVALLALGPAWVLLSRASDGRIRRRTQFQEVLVVAVSALLCLATSRPYHFRVSCVVVDDRAVYAVLTKAHVGDDRADCWGGRDEGLYRSGDGGFTWARVEQQPEVVKNARRHLVAREVPPVFPSPWEPTLLLRQGLGLSVEASRDGVHWEERWALPPERLEFMERHGRRSATVGSLIVSPAGTLVFPLGGGGVLVLQKEWTYSTHSVGEALARSAYPADIEEAMGRATERAPIVWGTLLVGVWTLVWSIVIGRRLVALNLRRVDPLFFHWPAYLLVFWLTMLAVLIGYEVVWAYGFLDDVPSSVRGGGLLVVLGAALGMASRYLLRLEVELSMSWERRSR